MRHAIQSIQTGQIVRWRVVHESAVFASEEEMVGEIDIGSSAVDERGPSLSIRSRDVLRIENQSTRASEDEGRPTLHGHPENISRRDFMRIGIHAKSGVPLRI